MKLAEIQKLSKPDLTKTLREKRQELSRLRISYRTEETKNVRSMRALKKDIARILTLLGQEEKANG